MPKPTGEVHPVAALFPMMSEEELDDLAADIQSNGLLHPVVLDAKGVLIDGRNRLEACRRAGVEPTYAALNGHDPVAFILSANVVRRHLSKGQQAMAVAQARLVSNQSTRSLAGSIGVSQTRIVQASVVLEHAPELAEAVLAGATPLDDAYRTAQETKKAAQSAEAQARRLQAELVRLRTEAPDLADLVVEERMALPEALAALRERQEQERQHRDLTTKLVQQAVSLFDPRGVTPAERAQHLCAAINPGLLPDGTELSQGRLSGCIAVLEALKDSLSQRS